ncbi:MAG: hypothetical protein ABW000_09070 [Actinoplanes sp.]
MDRFSIALIGDAVRALERLQQRTGLKKVDLINRALVVYDLIDEEIRQDKKLILRDTDGGEERIRIV